jgi:hypothetical protein
VDTLRRTAEGNDAVASAYRAARTRLNRFEEAGPPESPPKEQNVRMRLRGGRTGKRAVVCESLELTALQRGLDAFAGTVLAVTHDRWFAADFERFLIFGADGTVRESAEPVRGPERA